MLFEYNGDFKEDDFSGSNTIKTNNGKYEIKSEFVGDKVEIKKL